MDLGSLRLGVGLALPVLVALAVDDGGRRRGTSPPGCELPERRALLALVVALGVFLTVSLGVMAGDAAAIDPASLGVADLFLSPLLFLATLAAWAAVAFPASSPPGRGPWRGLGLVAARPGEELRAGLVAGAFGWALVLATTTAAAALAAAALGKDAVEELAGSPATIAWMAGLPAAVRGLVALSAGVFEEVFFRGLLQPRIGVAASSALFVLGHVPYGQPFLLLGVALLSWICGDLARRRGNVLAAIVAHALFDGIQLLVVLPRVLLDGASGAA